MKKYLCDMRHLCISSCPGKLTPRTWKEMEDVGSVLVRDESCEFFDHPHPECIENDDPLFSLSEDLFTL